MRRQFMSMWEILEIEPTKDKKEIKLAYSKLSKKYHPEDQPEEFMQLKNAYNLAMEYAKSNSSKEVHDNSFEFDDNNNEESQQSTTSFTNNDLNISIKLNKKNVNSGLTQADLDTSYEREALRSNLTFEDVTSNGNEESSRHETEQNSSFEESINTDAPLPNEDAINKRRKEYLLKKLTDMILHDIGPANLNLFFSSKNVLNFMQSDKQFYSSIEHTIAKNLRFANPNILSFLVQTAHLYNFQEVIDTRNSILSEKKKETPWKKIVSIVSVVSIIVFVVRFSMLHGPKKENTNTNYDIVNKTVNDNMKEERRKQAEEAEKYLNLYSQYLYDVRVVEENINPYLTQITLKNTNGDSLSDMTFDDVTYTYTNYLILKFKGSIQLFNCETQSFYNPLRVIYAKEVTVINEGSDPTSYILCRSLDEPFIILNSDGTALYTFDASYDEQLTNTTTPTIIIENGVARVE